MPAAGTVGGLKQLLVRREAGRLGRGGHGHRREDAPGPSVQVGPLGNRVMAQGTPTAPSGVTVDIAREIGARLGVPVELVCFDAARKSYEAMAAGRADICFLAVEPAREAEVAFTAPYVVIEGVFAVPGDSAFTTTRPGPGAPRPSSYCGTSSRS